MELYGAMIPTQERRRGRLGIQGHTRLMEVDSMRVL